MEPHDDLTGNQSPLPSAPGMPQKTPATRFFGRVKNELCTEFTRACEKIVEELHKGNNEIKNALSVEGAKVYFEKALQQFRAKHAAQIQSVNRKNQLGTLNAQFDFYVTLYTGKANAFLTGRPEPATFDLPLSSLPPPQSDEDAAKYFEGVSDRLARHYLNQPRTERQSNAAKKKEFQALARNRLQHDLHLGSRVEPYQLAARSQEKHDLLYTSLLTDWTEARVFGAQRELTSRLDAFVQTLADKVTAYAEGIPLQTEKAFLDYVNEAVFTLYLVCQKNIYDVKLDDQELDGISKAIDGPFEHAKKSLKLHYHQTRFNTFIKGLQEHAKEFKVAIETKDPAFGELLKSEDELLKQFQFQISKRREEAQALFDSFPSDFRENATKMYVDIAEQSKLLLKAAFNQGTFHSTVLETPLPGRVNPPTDEHKSITAQQAEHKPAATEEITKTVRSSLAQQYVTKVLGKNEEAMHKFLQDEYESTPKLKELFPDYFSFFINVGSHLETKQRLAYEADRDAAEKEYAEFKAKRQVEEELALARWYSDEADRMNFAATDDWRIGANEAIYDALAARIANEEPNDWQLIAREREYDLRAKEMADTAPNDWQLSSRQESYDLLAAELDAAAGQTRGEYIAEYYDEWAADLSAAANKHETKSLLERVQEAQQYTSLTKEKYQKMKDQLIAQTLPSARMIGTLPEYEGAEKARRWIDLTQGLRAQLAEHLSRGNHPEKEYSDFLDAEVQSLERLIVEKVTNEDIVNASDAILEDDVETSPYDSNKISSSSVATEPKALYIPTVNPVISHDSDEKGVDHRLSTETPMDHNEKQALENKVSAAWTFLTDTFGPVLLHAPQDETAYKNFADANKLEAQASDHYKNLAALSPALAELLLNNIFDAYRQQTNNTARQLADQERQLTAEHQTQHANYRRNVIGRSIAAGIIAAGALVAMGIGWYNTSSDADTYARKTQSTITEQKATIEQLTYANGALKEQLSKNGIAPVEPVKPIDTEAPIKPVDTTKPVDTVKKGTLESYLSALYANDIAAARNNWAGVEATYANATVSDEVQPLYAQFKADLTTATTPRDALFVFRGYRSILQQDLKNGSLTQDQFDASLGQALRDLNMGEYK